MHLFIFFPLPILLLLSITDARWREECNFGGNAQFNIIYAKPYLSTLCPSSSGRQICTMLDLSYCLMNSHGHVIATINCQMFGKNAPYQDTEVDLGTGDWVAGIASPKRVQVSSEIHYRRLEDSNTEG
ncbi:hypothetical protein CIB48_g3339 [Xylaria polymorpha]|nr:hypothetical protein CIB48_g3339 [Xylaria polymorpha]